MAVPVSTDRRGADTLEEAIQDARRVRRAICGQETTSGSICRAAPMGNGRCVQHGGCAEASDAAGGSDGQNAWETIARLGSGLDAMTSLATQLPLPARQQLVPEFRALALRAFSVYNELLTQNRQEAAAASRGAVKA